jgi:hypothetical protein
MQLFASAPAAKAKYGRFVLARKASLSLEHRGRGHFIILSEFVYSPTAPQGSMASASPLYTPRLASIETSLRLKHWT